LKNYDSDLSSSSSSDQSDKGKKKVNKKVDKVRPGSKNQSSEQIYASNEPLLQMDKLEPIKKSSSSLDEILAQVSKSSEDIGEDRMAQDMLEIVARIKLEQLKNIDLFFVDKAKLTVNGGNIKVDENVTTDDVNVDLKVSRAAIALNNLKTFDTTEARKEARKCFEANIASYCLRCGYVTTCK